VVRGLREFVRGDGAGLLRALAISAGVALAGAGYATGTMEWLLGRRPRGNASGWIGSIGSPAAGSGATDLDPYR
jgi:hypothetical protein